MDEAPYTPGRATRWDRFGSGGAESPRPAPEAAGPRGIDGPDTAAMMPDKQVIKLRFGLEDGYSRTLEEVGHIFEVTRERIRQIEAKALKKLRHPGRNRRLRDYIE